MNEKGKVARILIADDHAIFRDTLKKVLESESDFHVVGEAANGKEALEMVRHMEPDVLILDFGMSQDCSGIDVLRFLEGSGTPSRTILLAADIDPGSINEAFSLGARGLVMKGSESAVLFNGLRCVMAGRYWMVRECSSNPDPARIWDAAGSPARYGPPRDYGLTQRQLEVLEAVLGARTNKEIAEMLSISEQTVKHHLSSIFDKLGVYNRLELTLFALHHDLASASNKPPRGAKPRRRE